MHQQNHNRRTTAGDLQSVPGNAFEPKSAVSTLVAWNRGRIRETDDIFSCLQFMFKRLNLIVKIIRSVDHDGFFFCRIQDLCLDIFQLSIDDESAYEQNNRDRKLEYHQSVS